MGSGGNSNPFQGVSWSHPLGTQSALSKSALGQGLSTANNNFTAGAGALGNNINQANNGRNTNLNNWNNNKNNILNPGNWQGNVSQSSLMTGAGTPFAAGGNQADFTLPPGMGGLQSASRDNPNDPSSPGYTTPGSTTGGNPISAPSTYNGAQPGYMNNTTEQNFLNSYAKSLNPNVNYNINAQNNPNQFANAAVKGGLPSIGNANPMPSMGKQ